MAMIDSSVRFPHPLRMSVDGGVGGGDGCSGRAAESGGPGPQPRVGSYVCVVVRGEDGVRGTRRSSRFQVESAPLAAASANSPTSPTVQGMGSSSTMGQAHRRCSYLYSEVDEQAAGRG